MLAVPLVILLIFIKVTNEGPCLTANERNFFKVELWTKDDQRVERLLHAGNRIDAARAVFNAAIKHRPGGRYTIRQRCRVVEKWPAD